MNRDVNEKLIIKNNSFTLYSFFKDSLYRYRDNFLEYRLHLYT